MMETGMDVRIFDKFEKVYSGHFHTRSNDGKIFYLGNPYEMFCNDVNDPRGFHIFDTETLEQTPVDNPYRMFYNIWYEDENYKLFNATEYAGKIVKVIVKQKSNQKQFEKFYKDVFFPTLEKEKITTVIHMGDIFDSRKSIDLQSLEWSKRVIFEPLKKYKVHAIIGNHDCYYKNTNIVTHQSCYYVIILI